MKLNKIIGAILWILAICFMCHYNIVHQGIARYFYTGFFSCAALYVAIEIFHFDQIGLLSIKIKVLF